MENWDKFSENSFFFSTASKLALEHTEPSVESMFGTLSLRERRLWHEAGCSSAPSAEAECVQCYFHFLICLHVILHMYKINLIYSTLQKNNLGK